MYSFRDPQHEKGTDKTLPNWGEFSEGHQARTVVLLLPGSLFWTWPVESALQLGSEKSRLFLSARRQRGRCSRRDAEGCPQTACFSLSPGEDTWKHVNSIKYLTFTLSSLSSISSPHISRRSIYLPRSLEIPSKSYFRVEAWLLTDHLLMFSNHVL